MKPSVLLFSLFFLIIHPLAQAVESKLPLPKEELIKRCQFLSAEERQKYSVCSKVLPAQAQPNKELKKEESAKKPAAKELSEENIKRRCLSVDAEQRKKYSKCAKYQETVKEDLTADPYLGAMPKDADKAFFEIYGGALLTNTIRGFNLEAVRRTQHWAFGAFFQKQTIKDFDTFEDSVDGQSYGASVRYHFFPAWAVNKAKAWDVSLYTHLGLASYEGDEYETLPTFIYGALGATVAVPVIKYGPNTSISPYVDLSVHHIFHSSTKFLHLGNTVSAGIKIGF